MTETRQYVDDISSSLRAAGYAVELHAIGGWPTLTGYRADFRLRWMATKLHTFVCVRSVPVVTVDELSAFATASLEYTKAAKGAMRGAQSGVAAIAVLVGETVEPAAAEYARKELVRHFAAFAWPVTVDLSTGQRSSHQGRPAIGAIYTGWMRKQIAATLPAL
ncbi:hypothetical protein [Cellulomonas sp. ICMP 17802]|uniref:hypothetical protein n=1 Tax=Cellulomonas sp. ICMP 17802 TaxID=3239199 RepID=UPI00351BB52D